jgi:hypothetical protein
MIAVLPSKIPIARLAEFCLYDLNHSDSRRNQPVRAGSLDWGKIVR